MGRKSSNKFRTMKRACKALLVFAVATFASVAVAPATAQAADTVAYSLSPEGYPHLYYSVDAALTAGYSGNVIYMAKDWEISDTLAIADSKTIVIDMNGHQIKSDGSGTALRLEEHANLTLKSSKSVEFSYKGFSNEDGSQIDCQITTGGLVTGGKANVGGVRVNNEATLTLDNVAVAGNRGIGDFGDGYYSVGGMQLGKKSTVNVQNGATIEHNRGSVGGILLWNANGTVNLNNGTVRANYASGDGGGGIYVNATQSYIGLENNASICENRSVIGGGIFMYSSYFTIESKDKTGTIKDNKAMDPKGGMSDRGGGAIYVDVKVGSSEGTIKGLTITGNQAYQRGGAISLCQEWTRIIECTITGNTSGIDGGAIVNCDDNNSIENCTIENNVCDARSQGCTGGGVYTCYTDDIKLTGVCRIRNNKTYGGVEDDVFLGRSAGMNSYITGGVSKGSRVGIRTDASGDFRVGKGINNETTDCFFSNLEGYFITYGTDKGGDMWQRKGSKEYTATIDGVELGSYKEGAWVYRAATRSDDKKVFKCWSEEKSSGLYPLSEYIDVNDAWAEFQMPANDVNLVADYVKRTKKFALTVNAPVAGKALPTSARLSWTDPTTGETRKKTVRITWQDENGDLVVGKAKYNTYLTLTVSVDRDLDDNLAFATDIETGDISVTMGDSAMKVTSVSYEGDAASDPVKHLSFTTEGFLTGKATVESIESENVTVQEGASEGALRALLPATVLATTDADTTVSLSVDRESVDLSALLGADKKVKMPEGGSVGLSVPVEGNGTVNIPSAMSKVSVTVTVTAAPDEPEETVEVPEVTPAEGTYSTTKSADSSHFENGKFKVEATRKTSGSTVEYRVSSRDADGGWTAWTGVTDWPNSGELLLGINTGSQRAYQVEVWAMKNDIESAHTTYSYVVDDAQSVKNVQVAVKYTDTGKTHGVKKDYVCDVEQGSTFTFVAPKREGYVFEKWIVSEDDERAGTTLALENVQSATTVTAVYNPEITELSLDVDEPQAHKTLSTSATVKAKVAGSSEFVDITDYFASEDGENVLWTPAGTSNGKAEHNVTYTATFALKAAVASNDVKYVIASGAKVLYQEREIGAAAYTTGTGDSSKLHVQFGSTGPYDFKSITTPSDVNLTFEEAFGYQTNQDAGKAESWGLDDEVELTYGCKDCEKTELLDITWDAVDGFDASRLEAQTFTVKGKAELPDSVDAQMSLGEFEVTIRVTAPKTVKTPKASVEPGTYSATQLVDLYSGTDDAVIRYTTDGSDPDEDSPEYIGDPIEVAKTTTIKAKAYRADMVASDVAEFTYTIKADDGKKDDGGDGKKDDDSDKKDDSGDKKNDEGDSDKKDPGKDDSNKKDDASKGDEDADKQDPSNGGGTNNESKNSDAKTVVAAESTETVIVTKTSSSTSAIPGSGDYTLVTVAALLVIGIAIIAAAIAISHHKK